LGLRRNRRRLRSTGSARWRSTPGSYHAGKFLRPHGAVGSIGQALCRRFGGEGTALPVDSGLTASNIGMARELMLEDV
jgi:hypothetical protein